MADGTTIPGLPERIRSLRKLRGWSVADLASRCGTSRQSVEHWEAGRRTPKGQSLKKLADAFGLQIGVTLTADPDAGLDAEAAGLLMRLADVLRYLPSKRRPILAHLMQEWEDEYGRAADEETSHES